MADTFPKGMSFSPCHFLIKEYVTEVEDTLVLDKPKEDKVRLCLKSGQMEIFLSPFEAQRLSTMLLCFSRSTQP